MLLKIIRIVLVTFFVLALLATGTLIIWHYTHDDISPPVFVSDYDMLVVHASADDEILRMGLRAYDNMDGEITDRIMVKSVSPLISTSDALVTYLVFDEASNAATFTRTIRYLDYHMPRFALSKPLVYKVGDKITLLDRLTAEDVIDGDISGRILLTQSTVSNTTAGSYPITVQVTNSAGDTSILPLTIQVEALSASAPTVRLNDYLVYLDVGQTVYWRSYINSVQDPLAANVRVTEVVCNTDEVDMETPGVYEVYYYYIGLSGETATVILTVVVE